MGRTKKFLSSPGVGSFLSSVAAIIIGLLIGYIILLICNYQTATPALGTLLSGSFGLNGFSKTAARICYYAMPMIACGLAITFALKTGSFNIGVCGQYYIGMFVAILSAHLLKDTFGSLVWLPSLILGTLAGGIWALLPAILNAFRNVNIIISGIMMNYIGTYLVSLLIRKIDLIYFSSQAMTKAIPNEAILPKAGLDKLFPAHGAGANLGILICIAIGIIVYLVINRTTFGYELRACGFNRDAAKYAGINEKKSVVLAVFISGLLAGLGGAIYALSSASNNMYISDAIDGTGFTGICVALLGMTNPIGVIFAGFFVSFI